MVKGAEAKENGLRQPLIKQYLNEVWRSVKATPFLHVLGYSFLAEFPPNHN